MGDIQGGPAAPAQGSDDESDADGEGEDGEKKQDGGRRRRSRRGGRRARESRERAEARGRDETSGETGGEADDATLPPVHGEPLEPTLGQEVAQQEVAQQELAEPEVAEPVVARETNLPDGTQHETAAPTPVEPAREPVASELPLESGAPAPTAETHAATTSAPDAAPAGEPTPRRPEPVSTELDPARPKRSGWWQRAKATLGG